MPSYELGEHVEELARELGIIIIPPWVGSLAEEATDLPAGAAGEMALEDGGGFPVIWVSEEPTNARAYLVALHELGHHATAGKPVMNRLTGHVIEGEERAWLWAESKSLIPINAHLRTFIERRLDSYRD
jgi:hypothetical protein